MGNDFWEAKIYINDEMKTSIKVKNKTELTELRRLCQNIIPQNENYYFISRNNAIIRNDVNYIANEVWKDDEDGGYKIDLMTTEFYNSNQSGLITLYLNEFPTTAIIYKKNMDLNQIKNLGGNVINKDSIFFLTADYVIIENVNNFKAKDIIQTEKNGKKRINLVTRDYYKRLQVIEHLRKLEATTGSIDWLKQTEFFKKVKDFAGEEIANAIINELLEKIETNEKIDDKKYITRFLILLLGNKDNLDKTRSSSGF